MAATLRSPASSHEPPRDDQARRHSRSLSSGGHQVATGQLLPAAVPPSPGGSALRGSSLGGLTRLPDEAPDIRSLLPGISPTRGEAGSRPGSALSPLKCPLSSGGSRSGSKSRPGSRGSQSGKASLLRLPDAVPGCSLPEVAPASVAVAPASPIAGQRSTARDRMRMKLSVNTEAEAAKQAQRVFRVLPEGESVHDIFEFAEELQDCGNRGRVVCARRKSDRSEVVVKMRTKRTNKSNERNWRAVMTQLNRMCGSRHVLDITEILEDDNCFYVVMPKCNGGELLEFLITEAEVPESECKRIIREILAAVGHLHENNLIHRDVKPENLLFDMLAGGPQASPKTVKLIDFDTCIEWTPQTPKTRQFVGTPGYIAPEALLGEASPQSDLWSVGVILYILMTGETPWTQIECPQDGTVGSPVATRMYDALKTADMDWDAEPWPSFPEARDLCQKLTAFKTEDRLNTVSEALSHVWLAS